MPTQPQGKPPRSQPGTADSPVGRTAGLCAPDEYTIRDYARLLAGLGDEAQAETLLRKVLRNHWSDELINLYGRIQGQDPEEQLLIAEQWLKHRTNNPPELLLALGRLSLRNELWGGKAREYFETSLKLRRNRETLAELSRLNAIWRGRSQHQAADAGGAGNRPWPARPAHAPPGLRLRSL